jgi:hypothetical protein
MDISKLDVVKFSNDGYACVIKNPKDGTDTDITVTIKGVYADGFREGSELADTPEKTASFLAKYTVGWTNIDEDGKPVEFSEKEAARIYLKYPVIRGQVLSASMDVRNFIKG